MVVVALALGRHVCLRRGAVGIRAHPADPSADPSVDLAPD